MHVPVGTRPRCLGATNLAPASRGRSRDCEARLPQTEYCDRDRLANSLAPEAVRKLQFEATAPNRRWRAVWGASNKFAEAGVEFRGLSLTSWMKRFSTPQALSGLNGWSASTRRTFPSATTTSKRGHDIRAVFVRPDCTAALIDGRYARLHPERRSGSGRRLRHIRPRERGLQGRLSD